MRRADDKGHYNLQRMYSSFPDAPGMMPHLSQPSMPTSNRTLLNHPDTRWAVRQQPQVANQTDFNNYLLNPQNSSYASEFNARITNAPFNPACGLLDRTSNEQYQDFADRRSTLALATMWPAGAAPGSISLGQSLASADLQELTSILAQAQKVTSAAALNQQSLNDPMYQDFILQLRALENELSVSLADKNPANVGGARLASSDVNTLSTDSRMLAHQALSYLDSLQNRQQELQRSQLPSLLTTPAVAPAPALGDVPATMRVVGTYKPSVSSSKDKIYAQPVQSDTMVNKVIDVGRPIFSNNQSYGRVYPAHGADSSSQPTPAAQQPSATVQKLDSVYASVSAALEILKNLPKPTEQKSQAPLLPNPVAAERRPAPVVVDQDIFRTFGVAKNMAAEEAEFVDHSFELADRHPLPPIDENATKTRSKFREMLLKYSNLRQSKQANEETTFINKMKKAALLQMNSISPNDLDRRCLLADPVVYRLPILAADQPEPQTLSRLEAVADLTERNELKFFTCFTFDALPVSELKNLPLSAASTQKTLNRHLTSFLPRCCNQLRFARKCNDMHVEVFSQLESLVALDRTYETTIWDYDPRFAVDYLPGTKRGVQTLSHFVYNQTYLEEENKWRKFTHVLDSINSQQVSERIHRSNHDDTPGAVKKTRVGFDTMATNDKKTKQLNTLLTQSYDFPEHLVTEDYCGICEQVFNSIISSMNHYTSSQHCEAVHDHCKRAAEQLVLEKAPKFNSDLEFKQTWFDNTIRAYLKKFQLKPDQWLCDLCNVSLTSEVHARSHFAGTTHKKNASEGMSFSKQMELAEHAMLANAYDKNNKNDENQEDDDDEPQSKKLRVAPTKLINNAFVSSTWSSRRRSGYTGSYGY